MIERTWTIGRKTSKRGRGTLLFERIVAHDLIFHGNPSLNQQAGPG
jgi:hypothetical protein